MPDQPYQTGPLRQGECLDNRLPLR
jgi:hypothetical protein